MTPPPARPSAPMSASEVREWPRAAVELSEVGHQASLVVARDLIPRDRVPRDEHLACVGKLPDVAASPVPYRLARAEACELLEAPARDIGLADIDDVAPRHPACSQRLGSGGRICALKATRGVRVEKRRPRGGGTVHHVSSWTARNRGEAAGA